MSLYLIEYFPRIIIFVIFLKSSLNEEINLFEYFSLGEITPVCLRHKLISDWDSGVPVSPGKIPRWVYTGAGVGNTGPMLTVLYIHQKIRYYDLTCVILHEHMATATSCENKTLIISEVKFKILGSFRTLLLKYSINIFFQPWKMKWVFTNNVPTM